MNTYITNNTKSQFCFIASLASVVTSIFLYTNLSLYHGIFVGLWAPTLMGLSNRYKIAHASDTTRD
jgi:hypothetical protein